MSSVRDFRDTEREIRLLRDEMTRLKVQAPDNRGRRMHNTGASREADEAVNRRELGVQFSQLKEVVGILSTQMADLIKRVVELEGP